MRRILREARFRLVRLFGLAVNPWHFFLIYLKKVDQAEFFLAKLKGRAKATAIGTTTIFVTVLGVARRRFDAATVMRAINVFGPESLPYWALTATEIRLLLESALWLKEDDLFARLKQQMLDYPYAGPEVLRVVAFYEAFAIGRKPDSTVEGLVLPALQWEAIASRYEELGYFQEAGDALHKSLRHLPDHDPRRVELIARLFGSDALSTPLSSPPFSGRE
jgi:hypothetical protein